MRLSERISARVGKSATAPGKKSFTQPPFWQTDALRYPYLSVSTLSSNEEPIENDYQSYIERIYKRDGVVWAAIAIRQRIFSQVRFMWQPLLGGRPGDLFGNAELALLERPAPNLSSGDLLSRMLITADLSGNFYATTVDDQGRVGRLARGDKRIAILRPDWVKIIVGSRSGDPNAIDAKIVGYQYQPTVYSGERQPDPITLLPEEVCHFAPNPDPDARFRGMSWLTPILREIQADKAATEHKAKFFENGATPGMAVVFDKDTDEDSFDQFVTAFKDSHQGSWNAYKTLFLTAGADVRPLGFDLKAIDFSAVQGAGEARIAQAAGVPAPILGVLEGMKGSPLSDGNFKASRRLFVDSQLRHLWSVAASALEVLLQRPADNVRLWYDDREIPFLRDDIKELADIQAKEAQSIRTLLDAGYTGDSVIQAIVNRDWTMLQHSGLFSVQLQPPGTVAQAEPTMEQDAQQTA